MRIPIPEMGYLFSCTEDAMMRFIRISKVIVDKSKIACPSASVSDIPGYCLEFCRKVLIQAETLVDVARKREDYCTVCSLVRMLADNIATINLVYCCQDDEERILRHLLYVLDGIYIRHKLLNEREVKYDGKISKETFEALYLQVEEAKHNAEGCIKYCVDTIKKSPYYTSSQTDLEELISRRNWKFKRITRPKEAYSWKEMYAMLEIKTADEMFPYLSQYVHGLSVSNIALNDVDDFEAPLSFAICLLGWLLNFLRRLYEPQIGEYTWEDIRTMAPEIIENA